MLIARLGETRRELLAAIMTLPDVDLRRKGAAGWCIGGILLHLHQVEKNIAEQILGAIASKSAPVPERDLGELRASIPALPLETQPDASALTKRALIRALEESRFRYLQRVFNETHEATLTQKSLQHPVFGPISLKNLVDFVWLHEQYHTEQIAEIRRLQN